jgi:hypothetical protein
MLHTKYGLIGLTQIKIHLTSTKYSTQHKIVPILLKVPTTKHSKGRPSQL